MNLPAPALDPLSHALDCIQSGHPVALATVVGTWGSSPRPAGSMLSVDQRHHIEGSVSGGCVEADVVTAAQEILLTGSPRKLSYGVSSERAWEVGLACGGKLDVFVEALSNAGSPGTFSAEMLREIVSLRSSRRACVLITHLESAQHTLFVEGDALRSSVVPAHVLTAAKAALVSGISERVEDPDGKAWFVQSFAPVPRILVVGAVHIAQALAPIARMAGFDTTIIDPRTYLATAERFPQIPLRHEWPDEALDHLGIDSHTAVVTLTHDPKLDDPALVTTLRSPAFYVGALGSRKTQKSRIERLTAAGFSADEIARIHGPVGLPIGAIGASEIAVSIVSDIIAVRRGAKVALRDSPQLASTI